MPAILMFLFVHFNFKSNKLLTTINEYLLFKKYLFNKKLNVVASKKTACSFFYFFSVAVFSVPNHGYWRDLVFWNELHYWSSDGNGTKDFFEYILIFLVLLIIIRLIYEFLIIPYLYNRSIQNSYQKNMPYANNIINNEKANMNADFKFCSQCGTRYSINDTVCPKCGKN